MRSRRGPSPAKGGPRRMARQFGAERRIAAGGIHFRRGFQIYRGPQIGLARLGDCGGPARESVEKQIALIEEFVEARA